MTLTSASRSAVPNDNGTTQPVSSGATTTTMTTTSDQPLSWSPTPALVGAKHGGVIDLDPTTGERVVTPLCGSDCEVCMRITSRLFVLLDPVELLTKPGSLLAKCGGGDLLAEPSSPSEPTVETAAVTFLDIGKSSEEPIVDKTEVVATPEINAPTTGIDTSTTEETPTIPVPFVEVSSQQPEQTTTETNWETDAPLFYTLVIGIAVVIHYIVKPIFYCHEGINLAMRSAWNRTKTSIKAVCASCKKMAQKCSNWWSTPIDSTAAKYFVIGTYFGLMMGCLIFGIMMVSLDHRFVSQRDTIANLTRTIQDMKTSLNNKDSVIADKISEIGKLNDKIVELGEAALKYRIELQTLKDDVFSYPYYQYEQRENLTRFDRLKLRTNHAQSLSNNYVYLLSSEGIRTIPKGENETAISARIVDLFHEHGIAVALGYIQNTIEKEFSGAYVSDTLFLLDTMCTQVMSTFALGMVISMRIMIVGIASASRIWFLAYAMANYYAPGVLIGILLVTFGVFLYFALGVFAFGRSVRNLLFL